MAKDQMGHPHCGPRCSLSPCSAGVTLGRCGRRGTRPEASSPPLLPDKQAARWMRRWSDQCPVSVQWRGQSASGGDQSPHCSSQMAHSGVLAVFGCHRTGDRAQRLARYLLSRAAGPSTGQESPSQRARPPKPHEVQSDLRPLPRGGFPTTQLPAGSRSFHKVSSRGWTRSGLARTVHGLSRRARSPPDSHEDGRSPKVRPLSPDPPPAALLRPGCVVLATDGRNPCACPLPAGRGAGMPTCLVPL